jgi:hypothetical protein
MRKTHLPPTVMDNVLLVNNSILFVKNLLLNSNTRYPKIIVNNIDPSIIEKLKESQYIY